MKKSVRLLSAVFAAIMLVLCFASCGGSGTTTEKIGVKVWVYADAECDTPIVASNDISIPVGSTVIDAMDALCEQRGCTYAMGTDNQFASVTFETTTIEGSEKTLENGNVEMQYLGWKLNGTPMIDSTIASPVLPKDQVLNDGDKVIIYIVVEEVTPAAN